MKTTRKIAGLVALTVMIATGSAFAQQYGGPPPAGYEQGRGGGWDAPPPEFAAAQQRGYRDGIEGARKDFENHRQPNVNNRDEFRHPNFIAGPDRRDYKFGFKRGYDVAVRHMYGRGPR